MTNRRSFISSLLLGSVAPLFLPGAGRIWKSTKFASGGVVSESFFDFKPIGPFPEGYLLRTNSKSDNLEWFNPINHHTVPYTGHCSYPQPGGIIVTDLSVRCLRFGRVLENSSGI